MRRIYLREPSALIPTVTKNIFIKSKYIEHLSEKHHVDFQTMMVTVKFIVEKKNLTAKRIKDIIMGELRETFCPARMNVKLHESGSTLSVMYIRGHNHPIGVENPVHQPTPTNV